MTRMNRTYRITDHVTGAIIEGVDRYDVAATLKSLFPVPHALVNHMCDELQAKLLAGEYYGGMEAALNLQVDPEDER